MRVLVVDDDPDLVLLISLFLRRQGGHDVVTAGDGLEALDVLAADGAVEAVVLDWSMPRLDGIGLATAVRGDERWQRLPLLMVTAMPDHGPALEAGIDHVIRKPFDSATLLQALTAVVEARVA
ncbi:response regulator [Nocardioides bruguierae]|uniref:Response regulator n=1 Tax=Nocardioides bruguierae TaxID=2945102 RepID=A0A9X2D6K7_9ACTN|nr:response regulator [Nocardioides bruguierae]MCL8024749.1 response regulator [Nocardioides bruguierae]MCM0619154.1 response regulator [Nocardioides bruguierae]